MINDKELENQSQFTMPDKKIVKKYLGQLDEIIAHSSPAEKRKIVWMFVRSITLDPTEI